MKKDYTLPSQPQQHERVWAARMLINATLSYLQMGYHG